ncbi:MAG: DUF3054 domain-containing protein [Anaerolineales bacterium]
MASVKINWLIIGDSATLAAVTVFGFASHGTLGPAGMRLLTTYIPLLVAWFLVAPHLGVYDPARAADPRQLWRPFWSMVLAAPFAAWMRGAWLGTAILPIFVVVLGGISALAILGWRFLYWIIFIRSRSNNG